MFTMSCISRYLAQGHRHCDELFVAAENDVADGRIAEAEARHAAFQLEMEMHFNMEENVMFPAFEDATGMTEGPTAMMRMEHTQMRELLSRMKTALADRNGREYLGLSETLLMIMQQHNFKEEQILYPMADDALGGTGESVVKRMEALGESAH
jgi:DUF438 domain-containing protein